MRKDNPDATFGELSKLKGPLWKSLSEKQRGIYKQKAIELTKANLEALKSDSLADEEVTV